LKEGFMGNLRFPIKLISVFSYTIMSTNLAKSNNISNMEVKAAPVTVQKYLTEKRANARDAPVTSASCETGCTMVYDDTYGKHSRGVRAWQEAKFNHWEQRERQNKFFESQRKLEQMKRKEQFEATRATREAMEKKKREEEAYNEKLWNQSQNERSNYVVDTSVESCNDAWD
jgi:hypothetical protein